MKWISIIGAAAVLVVSMFIMSPATVMGTEIVKRAGVLDKVSGYEGEGLFTDTGMNRPTNDYNVILGLKGKRDVVLCGREAQAICDKGETFTEEQVRTKARIKKIIHYYEGNSCYVCSGGICFQVC